MILKIEIEEKSEFRISSIQFDFVNKCITYIKYDNQIKNYEILFDIESFKEQLKDYIKYWNYEYISNKYIDGKITTLKICLENEIIIYTFKNEFPHNYNDFLEFIKKWGSIND